MRFWGSPGAKKRRGIRRRAAGRRPDGGGEWRSAEGRRWPQETWGRKPAARASRPPSRLIRVPRQTGARPAAKAPVWPTSRKTASRGRARVPISASGKAAMPGAGAAGTPPPCSSSTRVQKARPLLRRARGESRRASRRCRPQKSSKAKAPSQRPKTAGFEQLAVRHPPRQEPGVEKQQRAQQQPAQRGQAGGSEEAFQSAHHRKLNGIQANGAKAGRSSPG